MTYCSRKSNKARGLGTPSFSLIRETLFSSSMMSMHSSTHSSQMNTVGPAISFLTSCWLLPQKEQYNVFFSLGIRFSHHPRQALEGDRHSRLSPMQDPGHGLP